MPQKIVKATFAQEVPEELITYELGDMTAKAFTPEAEALREYRKRQRELDDCWANDPNAWSEYQDIFDIRYLFDDEEIRTERGQYITDEEEESGDPYWYSNLVDDGEYYIHLKSEARRINELEERGDYPYEDLIAQDSEEVELWAEVDSDWEDYNSHDQAYRFVGDEYDSGLDEPNEKHKAYPPVTGERFLDLDTKEKRMQRCIEIMGKQTCKRNFNESIDFYDKYRKKHYAMTSSEPSCSYH